MASLFDSLGDQEATRLYVGMLNRIAGTSEKTPAEKARVLLETVSMVKHWCEIKHLGVKSAEEEFRKRFVENCHGVAVTPKLVAKCEMNSRLASLYAPWNSTENCLSVFKKKEDGTMEEYINTLLFIDTDGNIVRFEVYSKVERHMIGFSHEVRIAIATKGEVAEIMGRHPLIFDYCMRQLMELCEAAINRAYKRADVAQKSLHALKTITEEFRKNDLTVNILLFCEERGGMLSLPDAKDGFRRIVKMAGRTPEERRIALEKECAALHIARLCDLSGLSYEETLAVIHNPDYTAESA